MILCVCLTSGLSSDTPDDKGPGPSPWFKESVLPLGELDVPGSKAEGIRISGSVLSLLEKGWG